MKYLNQLQSKWIKILNSLNQLITTPKKRLVWCNYIKLSLLCSFGLIWLKKKATFGWNTDTTKTNKWKSLKYRINQPQSKIIKAMMLKILDQMIFQIRNRLKLTKSVLKFQKWNSKRMHHSANKYSRVLQKMAIYFFI